MNPLDTNQAPPQLYRELLDEPDTLRRERLWAISAPALISAACPSLRDLLGKAPAITEPLMPPQHRRLGLYFEDLIAELMQGSVDELHRNIQCRQERRTLGEFDFIYRRQRRWHHLETAVKFYLCIGDGSELGHFVGPGLRDRLDIKWQRLQQHQLQLSLNPAGQHTLADLGAIDPVVELLMPGYLFYHITASALPPLHPDISPNHLRGFWCTLSEFRNLPPQPATRYAVLPKLRWLAPARLALDDSLEQPELLEYLARQSQPVLLSLLRPTTDGTEWIERQRGFVVPDNWPERAAKASSEP